MKSLIVLLIVVVLHASDASKKFKRDSWRVWEAIDANCDSSPKGNPCVTCSCQLSGRYGNEYTYRCREDTKHCYGQLPCTDAMIKPGDCCPSCPNGPNCKIYGKVVRPSQEKIYAPGTDKEYSFCQNDGSQKRCFVSNIQHGTYIYERTQCYTS